MSSTRSGSRPRDLQCPRAGDCIDHPSRVDLSRVFGPAAANVPVGPHSHIVVNQIAKGKSLATVRRVRRQRPGWVTVDLREGMASP
jgi:hypothetical protein